MAFLVSIGCSAIPLLVALFAGLYYGGTIAAYGLYAAITHELGHIVVYILIYKSFPKITLKSGGVAIEMPKASRFNCAMLLSAGVAANILAVIISAVAFTIKPSYNGYFFAFANIVVALFNSLPFSFSDGGRLLSLFSPTWILPYLDQMFAVSSALLLSFLFYMILNNGSMVLQISLIGIIIIITIKIWIDYNDKKGA